MTLHGRDAGMVRCPRRRRSRRRSRRRGSRRRGWSRGRGSRGCRSRRRLTGDHEHVSHEGTPFQEVTRAQVTRTRDLVTFFTGGPRDDIVITVTVGVPPLPPPPPSARSYSQPTVRRRAEGHRHSLSILVKSRCILVKSRRRLVKSRWILVKSRWILVKSRMMLVKSRWRRAESRLAEEGGEGHEAPLALHHHAVLPQPVRHLPSPRPPFGPRAALALHPPLASRPPRPPPRAAADVRRPLILRPLLLRCFCAPAAASASLVLSCSRAAVALALHPLIPSRSPAHHRIRLTQT